jgi:hypothetical protein
VGHRAVTAEHRGPHYCTACDTTHTPGPVNEIELNARLAEARQDFARYQRWLTLWSAATIALAAATVLATWLGDIGLLIIFAIMTVGGVITLTAWWNMHDDRKTRARLRAWQRACRELGM